MTGRGGATALSLAAALGLMGPAAAFTPREAPRAPEIALAAKFDAALNAGRLDEAMDLVPPDGAAKDLAGRPVTGRDAIRAWLTDLIARHFHADAGIRQLSDGGRVTWTASLAEDGLRALDAAPVSAFMEVVVVDGKIRSWVPRVAAGDRLKIQAAQAKANEAVVRTLADGVFLKGQLDLIDRLCASGFLDHDPFPGSAPDLAGFKAGVVTFRTAFTGVGMSIEDLITADDRVVIRGTVSGTQKAAYGGVASSGRSFAVPYIDILRLRDGLIVEHWGQFDAASMQRQLAGTPPAPVRPAAAAGPRPAAPSPAR